MKVLVTGATGFIGRFVCASLRDAGLQVRAAVRSAADPIARSDVEAMTIGDLSARPPWEEALAGIQAVVHVAAIAHVGGKPSAEALARCRAVNVDATAALATAAARTGVRRFVFVSSAKVHGDANRGRPWRESDPPAPPDPYAQSKWDAEQALQRIGAELGMDVAILRPPLVYGPGVKANFYRLLQTVDRGWPIPLGRIDNRRSLIYVGNLAHAVLRCLEHASSAGRTFLVSDEEAVSTPELLRRVGAALERPVRLLPVPVSLLRLGAGMLGRGADFERLAGDLVVDTTAIRRDLGWTPPHSMQEGLAATAAWFRGASPGAVGQVPKDR